LTVLEHGFSSPTKRVRKGVAHQGTSQQVKSFRSQFFIHQVASLLLKKSVLQRTTLEAVISVFWFRTLIGGPLLAPR